MNDYTDEEVLAAFEDVRKQIEEILGVDGAYFVTLFFLMNLPYLKKLTIDDILKIGSIIEGNPLVKKILA